MNGNETKIGTLKTRSVASGVIGIKIAVKTVIRIANGLVVVDPVTVVIKTKSVTAETIPGKMMWIRFVSKKNLRMIMNILLKKNTKKTTTTTPTILNTKLRERRRISKMKNTKDVSEKNSSIS